MEGKKTDNLTEEQKVDIAVQTNALGEALAEKVALRSQLEAIEQKLQAFMQAKGHNQQLYLLFLFSELLSQLSFSLLSCHN